MSRFVRGRKPDPDPDRRVRRSAYEDRIPPPDPLDDDGNWVPIEEFIGRHGQTGVQVSSPERRGGGWVPLDEYLRRR